MSVSRSWTLTDEESEVELSNSQRAYLDGLMAEWSQISTEIENEGFRRQAAREDGWDNDEPDFDTDEEYEEYKQARRERDERKQVKLDVIEGMLAHYGARVMRPYEHWNEDERLMEYQESRYDY